MWSKGYNGCKESNVGKLKTTDHQVSSESNQSESVVLWWWSWFGGGSCHKDNRNGANCIPVRIQIELPFPTYIRVPRRPSHNPFHLQLSVTTKNWVGLHIRTSWACPIHQELFVKKFQKHHGEIWWIHSVKNRIIT